MVKSFDYDGVLLTLVILEVEEDGDGRRPVFGEEGCHVVSDDEGIRLCRGSEAALWKSTLECDAKSWALNFHTFCLRSGALHPTLEPRARHIRTLHFLYFDLFMDFLSCGWPPRLRGFVKSSLTSPSVLEAESHV